MSSIKKWTAKNRARRLKPPLLNVARTMGKWLPSDDFLLVSAISHVSDVDHVFQHFSSSSSSSSFSCAFSRREIANRWHATLFDAAISKMIYNNIKKLDPSELTRLQRLVPFSRLEHMLILELDSKIDPSQLTSVLEALLYEKRMAFHESRTAQSMRQVYERFKRLGLLRDQLEQAVRASVESDEQSIESMRTRALLAQNFDSIVRETEANDRRIEEQIEVDARVEKDIATEFEQVERRILRAELDLALWERVVSRAATGSTSLLPSGDEEYVLARLVSPQRTFEITRAEVSLGRSTHADFNLTDLVQGKRVSRLHCSISALFGGRDQPQFMLLCHPSVKWPVFVDGKCVPAGFKTRLYDSSVIEIESDLCFVFFVNENARSAVTLDLDAF